MNVLTAYVLTACIFSQQACVYLQHVLIACIFSWHVCSHSMHVLIVCMFSQHVCSHSMYVLISMYVLTACSQSMYVLTACFYFSSSCIFPVVWPHCVAQDLRLGLLGHVRHVLYTLGGMVVECVSGCIRLVFRKCDRMWKHVRVCWQVVMASPLEKTSPCIWSEDFPWL